MADISSIKLPDGNTYNIKDSASGYTTNTGTITKVQTTAGAHTAINVSSGEVSFNVPTTASHVGAAASSHAHGNITSGGDITATAPTIASGDQLVINDNSASKITNGPTFDGSTTTTALTPKGTWESFSKFSGSYNDLTNKPSIPSVNSVSGTLSVSSWSSYTQTITINGVQSTSIIVVSPAPSSFEEYGTMGVYCSAQNTNTLTFTCNEVPSNALTVNVLIINI